MILIRIRQNPQTKHPRHKSSTPGEGRKQKDHGRCHGFCFRVIFWKGQNPKPFGWAGRWFGRAEAKAKATRRELTRAGVRIGSYRDNFFLSDDGRTKVPPNRTQKFSWSCTPLTDPCTFRGYRKPKITVVLQHTPKTVSDIDTSRFFHPSLVIFSFYVN